MTLKEMLLIYAETEILTLSCVYTILANLMISFENAPNDINHYAMVSTQSGGDIFRRSPET
jgi:hypothetical protein